MNKVDFNEFRKFVSESFNYADVCRKLGWKPYGGNYKYVKKYIKELNLDISHFTLKGKKHSNIKNNEKSLNETLNKDCYTKAKNIKWKLFNHGLKEYKCEMCGISEWNGKQIGLQLHHINGDNTDNRIENLMVLCPNCHSQTDNYCGSVRFSRDIEYYCKHCGKPMDKTVTGLCDKCYRELITNNLDMVNDPILKKFRVYGTCCDCGAKIDIGATRCVKCKVKIERKVEWPSKEELEQLINEKSFVAIAKEYGVSDNAVRKWCKRYGLPHTKKDIKLTNQRVQGSNP